VAPVRRLRDFDIAYDKRGSPPFRPRSLFAKVKNDGFRVIKQVRMPIAGSQLPGVIESYQKKKSIPGLSGWARLGDNWGPGLYVPANTLTDEELIREVYFLTRSRSAAARDICASTNRDASGNRSRQNSG